MCAIWLAAVDGSSPPAKLSAITLTASLIDQAGRFLPELVTSARLNGHTWHDIAQALVTSLDNARLRSDPDSPVADPTTPKTAKAGPLQAVTTAPNPHLVGPDPRSLFFSPTKITGLLLRVNAAVEQFAIGMPQADPVTTKNGG
jgi:hypothetical protein